MTEKPIFETVNSNDILIKIKSILEKRNLGEDITYDNHIFYFSYCPDPTVIFQDDLNAKESVIFASQLRTILEPTGFKLSVKPVNKKR